MKEEFILNGQKFESYDLAAEYAAKNGWRITNTELIRERIYLITVSKTQEGSI